MLLSAASCGKREKDRIYKDSPWYSAVSFNVADHLNHGDKTVNYYMASYAGYDDGKIYYMVTGDYELPEDADPATVRRSDYEFSFLDVYSLDGTLVKSIDLNRDKALLKGVTGGTSVEALQILPADTRIKDGKLNLHASYFSLSSYELTDFNVVYDALNDEVVSVEGDECVLSEMGIYDTYRAGDYVFDGIKISLYGVNFAADPLYMEITEPDGGSRVVNVRQECPGLKSYEFKDMIYTGDGKALLSFYSTGSEDEYCLADLKTGKLSLYEEDTAWFSLYFSQYQPQYVEGKGYMFSGGNCIKYVDFKKKEVSEAFSFDNCNINRRETEGLSVISMTDDRIILSGDKPVMNDLGMYLVDASVFVLTKEKVNPNAGKTILRAATVHSFDHAFCEAVVKFNDTDPDYFITFDTKYSLTEKYYNGEMELFEGYDAAGLDIESRNRNQLMMDLMTGDGPDIILDSSEITGLNNDDYLLDMSQVVDTSGLFENVISLSKTDGKLYQIPLSFFTYGIITNKKTVQSGQSGFTYDQYKDFVDVTCNGKNPLGNKQIDMFIDCFAPVYKDHINGKNFDFGGEDTKALADYVKDNVFETSKNNVNQDNQFNYQINGGRADSVSLRLFVETYYQQDVNNLTILGYPTPDARGPRLVIGSSFAISAKTRAKDALADFVKILLSDEIQLMYAGEDYATPVNLSAYETSSKNIIDRKNNQIRAIKESQRKGGYEVEDTEEVDASVIENYKKIVDSCSYISYTDPAISIIIYEEMPAYFAGQKSFDEVTTLINNRATTYLNERG